MDSSRPVLRRTQPKVLPPQKTVKSPPILKKPVAPANSPPATAVPAAPTTAPTTPPPLPAPVEVKKTHKLLPSVQIPVPKIVRPAAPPDLSPASVHDLLGFGDEDDTSSIASSSCHSSPCFKKDSPSGLASRSFEKQRIQQRKNKQGMQIPPHIPQSSPVSIKKIPSPQELLAQRKLKISHYGRKQGSPKAVKASTPAELDSATPVKKRCGWICAQSDPAYIAYHDEEWGVPVYDDRMLFELLVLAGAQSEMGWSLILSRRESYRSAFHGFDIATVAAFDKKKVSSLKAQLDIFQQDGKLQAIVDNAGRVLQIVQEFGSLSNYIWGFFNHKTIVTSFRTSAQVPVKSSKSEFISKDLVRRGFQSVGPTTIYSFMQAAGMTNDHTLQCFRNKEINEMKTVEKKLQQDKCESVEHHQVHNVFVHVC